ncbi:MAG: peptidylprolyl isomerase [Flavobacteriales bacterium]
MYKRVCLIALACAMSSAIMAQTGKTSTSNRNLNKQTTKAEANPQVVKAAEDPVLMTISGKNITRSEFEHIFKKNNPKDAKIDRQALDEYLELFINFKLKVAAAEAEGKDTMRSFKNELAGYRRQLAEPYLRDKDVSEMLIQEAYERGKTDVHASHILIAVDQNASPKDTLEAFKKIIRARERVLRGESFDNVARQVSEDPSAKQNGGDLGYFTSMMMVYPFETAAYNTPIGEVSMPVRTRFGYHIVKVHDRRPAQGQVRVAHIMVRVPENASDSTEKELKAKIDEIYQRVLKGEDFGDLAQKYSDDRTSGKSGGQLAWFGTGRMVPEFEKAAFALKREGEVAPPVRTSFGYHIIKLLERKGIPSFDEVKGELKLKISKDSRSQLSRTAIIERVKTENNFREDLKALDELIKVVDTTYLNAKWDKDRAEKLRKPLFSIGNKTFTQFDFADYLEFNQSRLAFDTDIPALVRKTYRTWVEDKIIEFEDAQLEQKYDQFRLLMQEYRDGILLFEITDKMVWSKALEDSAGLAAFHEANRSKYMWGERLDAVIYTAKDEKTAKAARKLIAKRSKKGYQPEEIVKELNKTSQLNLQMQKGLFSAGENEVIDMAPRQTGISQNYNRPEGVVFVVVNSVLAPMPKSISEARGLITSDYQNYLEKEWLKSLRQKFPVNVNKDVLYSIQ